MGDRPPASALASRQYRDGALSPSVPATPEADAGLLCLAPALPGAGAPPDGGPSILDDSLPQPFPLPTLSPHELPTPLQEDRLDLSLSFAAAALPPTDVSLPTPPIVKTARQLRLPSFDLLGIAAPHPDRIPLRSNPSSTASSNPSFTSDLAPNPSFILGAGPLSKPEDPLHALSPCLARVRLLEELQGNHPLPVFTPPTEPGSFNWGSFANVRPANLGSPPSSESGGWPGITVPSTSTMGPPGSSTMVVPPEESSGFGMAAWVHAIKETITTESNCQTHELLKILSHALPCPSLTGHVFSELITALHGSSSSKTSWINVFHALPGYFTLSNLPKSPPSTPGQAVGDEEYFTAKIFDSAVHIPDYQTKSTLLPPSPKPVVPPGSVHISIVERYIPPTNANEYVEMFQLRGCSLLQDRLIELSGDNGLLVFIYPTRTGARTFMRDYLGPVLDPLLRSITVVHELSADLGKNLGEMRAVPHLDEYGPLKAKLEQFCHKLNEVAPKEFVFTVVHGSKENVHLDRSTWAGEWWVKQEKPRIRETVKQYFRNSKKLPESDMTSSYLIQEVLDGVVNRKYDQVAPRSKGVEVSVFVIKKTKRTE